MVNLSDQEALVSDIEPIDMRPAFLMGGRNEAALAAANQGSRDAIAFNREELDQILNIYGRKVAAGEWRDYAIDMLREKAVFSVFRKATEVPLYRIEKSPRASRKQGAYSVIAATGLILKRGHDLARVLRVLENKLKLVEH